MTATSYREVAQRVFATATNLLASGLILIVGIVMGRQMLASWSAASPAPLPILPLHEPGSGALDLQHAQGERLEFGDCSATLLRSEIRGDGSIAIAQLRRDCRAAASLGSLEQPIATAGLHDWLAQLESQIPAERNPGKWLLYERHQPLPMVVVVSDPPIISRGAIEQISATEPISVFERGVISWGLAFPADSGPESHAKKWTSFVIVPAPRTQKSATEIDVALPSACQRLIALRGDDSLLIGFVSNMEPAELAVQWDASQAAGGWRAVGDWQVTPAAWHRRYERPAGESVEVQFAIESHSKLLGFCLAKSR